MSQAGADVVLGARRAGRLAEVADMVEANHREAVTIETDVTDPADCEAMITAGMKQFGRIDVLINNAGIGTAVPALRERPEEFRAVVDVNLMGAYWMSQAAARVMRPGSSIVNIASVLGLVKSYAPQAAYAASKAGLIGLTRDLSQQWAGRRGIRVNAVAPGYFATELTASVPADQLGAFITQTATLGRMGSSTNSTPQSCSWPVTRHPT
jgi:NAD(P)-dependent dehydrogenase (short-subunit alcohol dehydrogenase family)